MIGSCSAPDPFIFNEYPNTPGNNIVAGHALQSSVIVAPSTTKTIITGGQSNMATAPGTTAYTTISALAQNLNIYDGGIYAGVDPVLGCSNNGISSINMRIADLMISSGKATRCIMVPVAVAGTPFAMWVPTATNTLFGRISTAILRCRARGLEPDAILWGEGEQDNGLGTSSADITASISAIVDGVRAMGCVAPFYVGLYSQNGLSISSTVRAGISNSVEAPRNIKLGFDADTNCPIAGGYRLVDNVHLSNLGLTTAATAWQSIAFP